MTPKWLTRLGGSYRKKGKQQCYVLPLPKEEYTGFQTEIFLLLNNKRGLTGSVFLVQRNEKTKSKSSYKVDTRILHKDEFYRLYYGITGSKKII